jgi:trk system potassium uptake protein TrkA
VFAVQALWARDAEVIELQAEEASKLVARPLKDTGFPKGAMVLAVSRGESTVIPTGDTVIQPGDHVVSIVQRGAIQRIEKIFAGRTNSLPPPPPRADG